MLPEGEGFTENTTEQNRMAADTSDNELNLRKRAKFSIPLLTDNELKLFSVKPETKSMFCSLQLAFNTLMFGNPEADTPLPHARGDDYILAPLEIKDCNSQDDVSFFRCFMKTSPYDGGVRFGHVYGVGLKVLHDFLSEKNTLPEDPGQKNALNKLLTFLCLHQDSELQTVLGTVTEEAEMCLFFMNHLISPLSVCDTWRMDERYGNDCVVCPCSSVNCPLDRPRRNTFADLSMGNVNVWHGATDAATYRSDEQRPEVPIMILGDRKGCSEESPFENKLDASFEEHKAQLYGQAVVFSFLQCMHYPELSFVPVLAITKDSVLVALYDCKLDVLLTSKDIAFVSHFPETSYIGLLVLWLICNYKLFSSPLSGGFLDFLHSKKSNFFYLTGEKLMIYKNNLRFKQQRRKNVKETIKFKSPLNENVCFLSDNFKVKPLKN